MSQQYTIQTRSSKKQISNDTLKGDKKNVYKKTLFKQKKDNFFASDSSDIDGDKKQSVIKKQQLVSDSSFDELEQLFNDKLTLQDISYNDYQDYTKKVQKNINKPGGSNTNKNGLKFEDNTCSIQYFKQQNYVSQQIKNKQFLFRQDGQEQYFQFSKNVFNQWIKQQYQINIYRIPDEAFVKKTNDKIIIKILEKKFQQVEGSAETKLYAAPSLKQEYQIFMSDKIQNIQIEYALCVNDFFEQKFKTNHKYSILKQILDQNNIQVFYGQQKQYHHDLYQWIHQ